MDKVGMWEASLGRIPKVMIFMTFEALRLDLGGFLAERYAAAQC